MENNMTGTSISPDRISPTGGRRSGIERREFSFTAHVPERRSGGDRRRSDDRRQQSRKFPDSRGNAGGSAENN